jgi:hypothetical protein
MPVIPDPSPNFGGITATVEPWPFQGPRHLYTSVCTVSRLVPSLTAEGDMSLTWGTITDVVDVWLDEPGFLQCRIEPGYLRRGIDIKAPLVAGRAPDRIGLCWFDPIADPVTGALLVKAGDRLVCYSGPVYGTWELRATPDPAVGYSMTHHAEVQVIEVAQALTPGSLSPFPGGSP